MTTSAGETALFTQAYDVESRARPGDKAELYCLVVSRHGGGRTLFWHVTDGSNLHPLQLGLRAEDFDDASWEAIRRVKEGTRLRASGIVGVSNRGDHTVWLAEMPMIQPVGLPETLSAVEPHRQRVSASLFVAHFRSTVERELVKRAYLQIDTRFLANDWHGPQTGPHILKALYPGFGLPMYIATSPSPQLVAALIATSRDKVFTASSIFTSSFRERPDGSEASIVMAKTLNLSLGQLAIDADGIILAVLDSVGMREQLGDPGTWIHEERDWPESFPSEAHVAARTITYTATRDARRVQLRRYLIPPGNAVAEVAIETTKSGLAVGTSTFYLERFLPLVQNVPIKRLHSVKPLFAADDSTGTD